MTESGVFIRRKRPGIRASPAAVARREDNSPNRKLAWIAFCTILLSFAPKYREMMTPPPIAIPLKNPIIRKVRLPPELTAAKASLSAKFPTTQASAIL